MLLIFSRLALILMYMEGWSWEQHSRSKRHAWCSSRYDIKVLSRFEGIPTKKLKTMRTAAGTPLIIKCNDQRTTHLENRGSRFVCSLTRLSVISPRSEGEIGKPEQTKDEEIKKFQSQKTH